MYVAMNRFRVARGSEAAFEAVWRDRDSHLDGTPGFVEFRMLRGPTTQEATLYISQSRWKDETAFRDWTRSENFRRAHAKAGSARDLYLGPPVFEGFEVMEGI